VEESDAAQLHDAYPSVPLWPRVVHANEYVGQDFEWSHLGQSSRLFSMC
jgi:hypothetical protein